MLKWLKLLANLSDEDRTCWGTFWGSIFGVVLLPLVPLLIELIASARITTESSLLAAAMYAATTSAVTRYQPVQYICLFLTVLLSTGYGINVAGKTPNYLNPDVHLVVVAVIAASQAYERHQMHVVEGKPMRG